MVLPIFLGTTAVAIVVIAGGLYGLGRSSSQLIMPRQSSNKKILASLNKATGWINSKGLTVEDLRGKVVLINFCTYTCINWLRTLPYIKAWSDKYTAKGLVVIGIHTPEFEFEKKPGNVLQAIKEKKIGYAIATDNRMAIWYAFDNNYWPAFYFIDAKGNIRHQQTGEGDYDKSEKIIQQLLEEAGATDIDHQLVSVDGEGDEFAADWGDMFSQENYFGDELTENFIPNTEFIHLNQWTLAGNWTTKRNSIVLYRANGKIFYKFHARDLHLVMGPVNVDAAIRFRVLINGEPPVTEYGTDIDEQGYGIVTAQRLYQLIRQKGIVADRQFEIEFLDPGVEVFSVTFG